MGSDKEQNSKIVLGTPKVPKSSSFCVSNNIIDKNVEVKHEQLETEEMPTFEYESSYLDNKIKKEIKIEPSESVQDGQLLGNQGPGWKLNQGDKDSTSHYYSSVHENSTEHNVNRIANAQIKTEELEFDDMPIFESDSTY